VIRRRLPAVIAMTLAMAVLGQAPARAAPDASCNVQTGGRPVVILVHGFNASPAPTWDAVEDRLKPRNLYVERFDYSHDHGNTQWVTSDNIGPALATRINCLAAKSRDQGGPGKVIAVGHSMGGLAIRCALQPACSKVEGVEASVAQAGLLQSR